MVGFEATLAEVDGRKKDIVKNGENFKYSYIAGNIQREGNVWILERNIQK